MTLRASRALSSTSWGTCPEATEGNIFGKWNPETYEVEDSAFGFITMKNGATIELEASWALNILESREASTTLCGTLAGAEIRSGMSYPKDELIMNRGANGLLLEEHISETAGVAYLRARRRLPAFWRQISGCVLLRRIPSRWSSRRRPSA